jgi:dipeptidyl aminopeptidase/acylaminoacyl peptidase
MKSPSKVFVLVVSLGLFVFDGAARADEKLAADKPYPLEYWALREVVSNAQVSPDGKHIAMLKILSKEGDPILHIYETDNLEDPDPVLVNSDPMEIQGFQWVSDREMVMLLRQKVRNKIEGQNQGVYEGRITRLNIDTLEFDDFGVSNPNVESLIENDPDTIMVSTQPGVDEGLGFGEAFRPRAYYRLNLKKGTKQLAIRGRIDMAQFDFDADGAPYIGRGLDTQKQSSVWYYRPKGGKGWDEIYRQPEESFEDFEVLGKDDAVPGNLIVRAHNGQNFASLWSFNTKTKQFDELLYRRNDVDVLGVRFHSNGWANPGKITAVSYFKDNFHYEYFDETEGAMYKQLEELIPYAHYVRVTSRSRDGNTMTIMNSGPRDPGSHYMYRNGEFTMVGSQQPLLEPEKLASTRYIRYKARDGLMIGAHVTIPNGEPPFPLIVLPHGGPEVLETIVYDEWAQLLANYGYMVMQPQYRISRGYGLEHFKAGFKNGALGRAAQDDKDDGALYLVQQGLADPDRMAMFGWSYGGYAALVAASRAPQLYQCVIAGAAVADPVWFSNEFRNAFPIRAQTKIVLNNRDAGIRPAEEVENVNVPVMLVHGDVDQRVQYYNAKRYASLLEKHGKTYKLVKLEGADHFYNTLYFEHQIKLYESMIDFLQNDCGPGGL